MLSSDGAVKILDFGIAKALGGDKDESTKTGTLKGKFAYMAPEQTVSMRSIVASTSSPRASCCTRF